MDRGHNPHAHVTNNRRGVCQAQPRQLEVHAGPARNAGVQHFLCVVAGTCSAAAAIFCNWPELDVTCVCGRAPRQESFEGSGSLAAGGAQSLLLGCGDKAAAEVLHLGRESQDCAHSLAHSLSKQHNVCAQDPALLDEARFTTTSKLHTAKGAQPLAC